MPRRRKYNVTAADLAISCTGCGYAIPPEKQARLDAERMRCPECGVEFVPVPKGNWSQLHAG